MGKTVNCRHCYSDNISCTRGVMKPQKHSGYISEERVKTGFYVLMLSYNWGDKLKQKLIIMFCFLLISSLLATNALAMTKSELIDAVAKKSGQSKGDTTEILDAFFDVTTEIIEEQNKLNIGFSGIQRIGLFFAYKFINDLGLLLGADQGESIMCVVDSNIIGKTVRFGDGILGRRLPS